MKDLSSFYYLIARFLCRNEYFKLHTSTIMSSITSMRDTLKLISVPTYGPWRRKQWGISNDNLKLEWEIHKY